MMDDEFIYWRKLYLLLSAKFNLVSDNNHNSENYNPQNLQVLKNNVALKTFSVGETIPQFTISIEQDK